MDLEGLHIGIEGGWCVRSDRPHGQIPDAGKRLGVSGKAGYGFGPGYTELSFTNITDDTSINLKVGGKFQL